jgi:pyruvate dehydrogenase E2 component (dihydrolipoamide acetyltransferase)
VQTGETALVGAVVAVIAGEGGATASAPLRLPRSAPPPLLRKRRPRPSPRSRSRAPCSRPARSIRSSRCARRRATSVRPGPRAARRHAARPPLAGEGGIDLSRCRAPAPRGRIVAADIESAIAKAVGRAASAAGRRVGRAGQGAYKASSSRSAARWHARHHRAPSGRGKQTIPHFYLVADVTMDALLKIREEANSGAPKDSYKLSVNDFVIKALALALQRVPRRNAVWAGDRILRFKHSDVGVAVAIDGGLLTPVIRNAMENRSPPSPTR